MFRRELTLFLFVVVVYVLGSVQSEVCSNHIRCAEGDHAIHWHGKCVCKRVLGYCSTNADCGYEHCGSDYEKYCHVEKHQCGCIKAPENNTQCTVDSHCSGIHCRHSGYMHICHNRKCHCMKHVPVPECTYDHHHHHHSEAHCPASSCHSPYNATCVNDHCICISDPPPCHSDTECGSLRCDSNQSPQCVHRSCKCTEIPTVASRSGCTNDSECVNSLCSEGDHLTCHDGKCVCKRDEGYCSTTSHCYYLDCEREWHHHCHDHECGCIHAPHGSSRCSKDSSCSGLHCSHSKAICSSGKCQCMKITNTHSCHSTRAHHHDHPPETHCPHSFCDSPYSKACIRGHCVCLKATTLKEVTTVSSTTREITTLTPISKVPRTTKHVTASLSTTRRTLTTTMEQTTKPTTIEITTLTPITKVPSTTKHVTASLSTTRRTLTTTMKQTTKPTTIGSNFGVVCPHCDGSKHCTWNRTCSDSETCMIRSHKGSNPTIHCSAKSDCHFMHTTSADVNCCNDRQCIETNLGFGTQVGIPCPVCDELLKCTWNRTCPETQTCMIRSYEGYSFTVHCSMADDCHFIQSTLTSGEIFCCNDRQCLSTYLGI